MTYTQRTPPSTNYTKRTPTSTTYDQRGQEGYLLWSDTDFLLWSDTDGDKILIEGIATLRTQRTPT